MYIRCTTSHTGPNGYPYFARKEYDVEDESGAEMVALEQAVEIDYAVDPSADQTIPDEAKWHARQQAKRERAAAAIELKKKRDAANRAARQKRIETQSPAGTGSKTRNK